MNAETGTEPESPKKRGRIPQSAWPQILERYRSGATLSAIAREFECTPSAISYILRKAEAAGGETEAEAAVLPLEAPAGEAPSEPAAEAAETPAAQPARAKPARRSSRAAAPEGAADPAEPAAPAAAQPSAAQPPGVQPPSAQPPSAQPEAAPAPSAAPAPVSAAPAPVAAPTSIHSGETLRLNRPEPQPPVEAAAPAPQPAPVAAPAEAPRGAAQRAEPTPPVDAVEARLRETARGCLSAYRSWRQQGEGSIQALSEAVHELRKALARIEIDMSASRREEQAIRPIPIPAHRTSRRTP